MVVHYLTQYAKINILNHRFFNHDSKNYLDKKKAAFMPTTQKVRAISKYIIETTPLHSHR